MKTFNLSQQATRAAAMLVFALICVFTTSLVFAQARLVKDMNTTEYRHYNEYSQLTDGNGQFYFVSRGKELWTSDGTTSGTRRLKTIGGIKNLTFIDNVLYFSGTDGSGAELWRSDGTPAGTFRLKDIRRGLSGSSPGGFTNVNGTIFFVADNGTGYELWKTNGTSAGTVLVKDIWTGTEASAPSYLMVMNDVLYFSADDGVHGRELWKSDGTPAGTMMVKDIQPQEGESSDPMELVTMNGFLFFSANHSLSGRELWRSDGTSGRTIRLKDINPGAASSEIGLIRRMGNAIYFNAKSGATGTALWRSSGTTSGTVMLKDLTSDDAEYEVSDMTVLNNRIYWLLNSYAGREVWVSNGTAAGTRMVTTFENRDTPPQFTLMNNKVYYFSAYWSQDPYAPFQQLCSMNPDGSGWREIWGMWTPFTVGGEEDEDWYEFEMDIIAFNNALFFPGVRNETEGYKLLKSNGSEEGLTVLADTYKPTRSSAPVSMVKNNSGVYLTTTDYTWYAQHLWRSDGTTAGTVRLKTVSQINNIIDVNNTIYFSAYSDSGAWQLWKTDGTPSGTILMKELPYIYTGRGDMLANVGGTLFFSTTDGELWKSNGTPAGTVLVKKFPAIEHVASFGTGAYILVRSASGGQELWKTNGLPAETVKVKTIRSVEGISNANDVTSATLGNIFYFIGNNGTHGHELWRTDGTTEGTYMVKDIRTGDNNQSSDFWRVTVFNNILYINAVDAAGQLSLFRSDGTSAGTFKIYDAIRISDFILYQDQLLFIASNFYTLSLWSTDGTMAGTTAIKELSGDNFSLSHVQLGDFLYLSTEGSDVIWRTDGTECGTFTIDVGLRNINPLSSSGSDLLLAGHHDFYGKELFAFNVSNVSAPSCPESLAVSQKTSDEDELNRVTYNPNPFDRDFTFVVNSKLQETAEVAVYDMAGHPLTFEILETNIPHQLGNKWKEGIYIMRILVDGKVTVKKVIKGRP